MDINKYTDNEGFITIEKLKEMWKYLKCDNNSIYKYIWYQQNDKMNIGTINECDINIDILIEARIFAPKIEMHIFQYDDKFKVYIKKCNNNDDSYIERQKLKKKYGEYIDLRHYLDKDEDGQVFIKLTCLDDYKN